MFKKLFITVGALVALAVPSAAMADAPAPAGQWTVNSNAPAYTDMTSQGVDANYLSLPGGEFDGGVMGEYNSRVIQNGINIREVAKDGLRSSNVQAAHALEGKGSLAK